MGDMVKWLLSSVLWAWEVTHIAPCFHWGWKWFLGSLSLCALANIVKIAEKNKAVQCELPWTLFDLEFYPQLPVSFLLSSELQLAVLSLVFQPKGLVAVNWPNLQIHLLSTENLPFLAGPDTAAGSFSHRFYSDYFRSMSLLLLSKAGCSFYFLVEILHYFSIIRPEKPEWVFSVFKKRKKVYKNSLEKTHLFQFRAKQIPLGAGTLP